MKYAHETKVSVAASRTEIEQILTRYGADQFASGFDNEKGLALIQFRVRKLCVCFELPLPSRSSKAFNTYRRGSSVFTRAPAESERLYEQACRQRWRALALCIKAKLEAVECGITTFEEEFLAHVVMPDGQRIGKILVPQLEQAMSDGRMPAGLLAFESSTRS